MIVILKPSVMSRENIGGWLNQDTEYVVLEVGTMVNKTYYRIQSEDNQTPALFEASLFRIVDPHLPASWIAMMNNDVFIIKLIPIAWAEEGFWERYFDGNCDALKIYADVVQQIYSESKKRD